MSSGRFEFDAKSSIRTSDLMDCKLTALIAREVEGFSEFSAFIEIIDPPYLSIGEAEVGMR